MWMLHLMLSSDFFSRFLWCTNTSCTINFLNKIHWWLDVSKDYMGKNGIDGERNTEHGKPLFSLTYLLA